MYKLIQNELTKVFKRKNVYIALVIVLVCIIGINCINRFNDNTDYYGNIDANIANMEEEIKKYDPKKPSDTSIYISQKSYLDGMKLVKQYGQDSWQTTIIRGELSGIIEQMNTYLYASQRDEVSYQQLKEKYDSYIQKFEKDDWKYFAKETLKEKEQELKQIQLEEAATVDKAELKSIANRKKDVEMQKQIIDWRLEKEISYAQSDKNQMLQRYESYQQMVNSYESNPTEEYEDKIQYQTNLAKAEVLKYEIQNNIEIKSSDCRGGALNFFSQYGIFIIAIVIMISGTILSDEFNKGTIKLLLVKPYKRWKILVAKLITCIIAMLILSVVILGMQLLVSGILFGFDSLTIPQIYYNFTTNQIETMNVFSYVGIMALTQIPIYLVTIMIAFMLSCLFNNSALAIVISLLGYMSTPIINMMALELKLGFMKYYITPNWDLSVYLFGKLPGFQGLTLGFSIGISILYFAVMLIISIFAFKKKNIKNI